MNFIHYYLVYYALLLGCKTVEPVDTLVVSEPQKLNSLHLMETTSEGMCQGQYPVNRLIIDSAKNSLIQVKHHETIDRLLSSSLSAVHPVLQDKFVKFGGEIVFHEDLKNGCPNMYSGLQYKAMCLTTDDYVPKLHLSINYDKNVDAVDISQGIVRMFGKVYDRLLSRVFLQQGKALETFNSITDETAFRLTDTLNQLNRSNISFEYADLVFASIFDQYYCSKQDRKHMQTTSLPLFEIMQRFNQYLDSLQSSPEQALSLNRAAVAVGNEIIIKSGELTIPKRIFSQAVHISSPALELPNLKSMDYKVKALPDATQAKYALLFKQKNIVKQGAVTVPTDVADSFKDLSLTSSSIDYKPDGPGDIGYRYTGEPRLVLSTFEAQTSSVKVSKRFEGKTPMNIYIPGTFQGEAPAKGQFGDPEGITGNALVRTYGGRSATFQWSCTNNHEDRIIGGKALADTVESLWRKDIFVNLVGHSHGGTLLAIALAELKKRGWAGRVNEIITTARPVKNSVPMHLDKVAGYFIQSYSSSNWKDPVALVGRVRLDDMWDALKSFGFGTKKDPKAHILAEVQDATHKQVEHSLQTLLDARRKMALRPRS